MDSKQKLRELGEQFRLIRESKGLSQNDVALRIDKSQQSIQRFEKGRRNISYIYLLELCQGLEIELEELITKKI